MVERRMQPLAGKAREELLQVLLAPCRLLLRWLSPRCRPNSVPKQLGDHDAAVSVEAELRAELLCEAHEDLAALLLRAPLEARLEDVRAKLGAAELRGRCRPLLLDREDLVYHL